MSLPVDFSRSPSHYGPFLHGNIYLPPDQTHTEAQPDGRKEGALEGKCCVSPRVQCYFLNGFGFYLLSSYVVCDSSEQQVQRKRNETDCAELFKIKQKSRGSGTLSQASHSTNSQILVISCAMVSITDESILNLMIKDKVQASRQLDSTQKPPGQRRRIFPNCHLGALGVLGHLPSGREEAMLKGS